MVTEHTQRGPEALHGLERALKGLEDVALDELVCHVAVDPRAHAASVLGSGLLPHEVERVLCVT